MCGINGIYSHSNNVIQNLEGKLELMSSLQRHRGPDGKGVWISSDHKAGFAHQRLSIIDLNDGKQPMKCASGNIISFNGEIYNYLELKEELKNSYNFKTNSDTEVILASYLQWGHQCLSKLRGMFAFAIFDILKNEVFCARDHFGIKPFYYTVQNEHTYFASEVKSLLPFVNEVAFENESLIDYLDFQSYLGEKTLFKNVNQLKPGNFMIINKNGREIKEYWKPEYNLNLELGENELYERLEKHLLESIHLHTRSDVEIGAYVSGGIDSSFVASVLARNSTSPIKAFNGTFSSYGSSFDESHYAKLVAKNNNMDFHLLDMDVNDFSNNLNKIVYHMDYPTAGPGVFPQFMVSKKAAEYVKVVLGGQGGDEVFGGYSRYLVAYFEQCLNGAIDGTNTEKFIIRYESIQDSLNQLKQYKPMLQKLFASNLFGNKDEKYLQILKRGAADHMFRVDYNKHLTINKAINIFNKYSQNDNVSYFDEMTLFDINVTLPGLLHVEDRASMAHSIESRVPLLDIDLFEFVTTIPAKFKFKDGKLKRMLTKISSNYLPEEIVNRKDKMGFPVPLNDWFKNELRDYILDVFKSSKAQNRDVIDYSHIVNSLEKEGTYDRNIWGALNLELWQLQFVDQAANFRSML